LDEKAELRDKMRVIVRGLEKAAKRINYHVLDIHRDSSFENLKLSAEKGMLVFATEVHLLMEDLEKLLPKKEHYKYNEVWRFCFQRLAVAACTIQFLIKGTICTLDECAAFMNLPTATGPRACPERTLILDYDEYLVGLLEMGNELSRLSRNCITFGGSVSTVFAIHSCLNQLNTGMHYITFKNDHLRKRYDGLKYYLKTVEEVVYDLKMRDIKETDNTAAAVSNLEVNSESNQEGPRPAAAAAAAAAEVPEMVSTTYPTSILLTLNAPYS